MQWQSSSACSYQVLPILVIQPVGVSERSNENEQGLGLTRRQMPLLTLSFGPGKLLFSHYSDTQESAAIPETDNWSNSIESNVVILASCIPTLQPLLEIVLGKRNLRSTGAYNYRESSTPLPTSNKWSSKRSGPRRDKNDLIITDTGSQDSILQAADDHGVESHYMGRIRRTDNITVEYETVAA